ncbi:MAG: DoxX family membrane protein [Ignavibacteria bacterium]|nr:DoxX family membrane protein [Ignavibacteria bacterium]
MRRTSLVEIITVIFRLLLGLVFIYASIGKIADPTSFFKEISNYRLFPDFLSQIFAIFIPWLELIVGIFLIFGLRLRTTSFVSLVLLVSFTLLVLSAWARGLNINCGCFSHHIEYVGLRKILENLGLIIINLLTFLFPKNFYSIETLSIKDQIIKVGNESN